MICLASFIWQVNGNTSVCQQVREVPHDLAGLAEQLSRRHALASAKQAKRLDMAFKALADAAQVKTRPVPDTALF